MHGRWRAGGMGVVVAALVAAGAAGAAGAWMGCSSKQAADTPSCLPVADGCAGVPAGDVCAGDACTDGVACATTFSATDDATLADAAGKATSGSCIVLHPGSYVGVALPGGVSLLGKGASAVQIGKVEARAGSGAVIRGLTIGAGGLSLDDDVVGARVDSVRVSATTGNGVTLGARCAVTIVSSAIERAGWGAGTAAPAGQGYGILASGATSLSLEKTRIVQPAGPGLWVQSCTDGCACNAQTSVAATGIIIEGAELVGASLAGVKGTLSDLTLSGTIPFHVSAEQGGGLSIAQCSDVTASGLHVAGNAYYGVLVDNSSAKLGDASHPEGIIIEGNEGYGVWMQHIGQGSGSAQSVALAGAKVRSNVGVGIGIDGASRGIIIEGCSAEGTASKIMPALVAGTTPAKSGIGDGLSWMKGSSATIKSLSLAGNARTGALIAGQWGDGSSASLQLGDGNAHGIIIEGVTASTAMPGMESVAASQVTRTATFDFPVAIGPAAPAAIK